MKTWYTSKTLWINAIAAIALLIQSRTGFVIDLEIQTALLTIVNFLLRIITKAPLDWKIPSAADEQPPSPPAAGLINPLLLPALALIGLLLLAGCATTGTTAPASNNNPQILAGKSLLAVKGTIVTAANATNALCQAQKLTVDDCARAKDAYATSKLAYDAAVDAYLLMSAEGGDPAAFGAALIRLQSIAQNLVLISGGAH